MTSHYSMNIQWSDEDQAFVVTLPAPPERPTRRAMRSVPDVQGLGVRDAVRSLHKAGFRVQLARAVSGAPATLPAAGELAPTGTIVRLLLDH